ncbi:MAG TPA: hypothetical protein VGL10_00295, partial [Gammaproteobacteria bacterium]
WDDYLTCKLEIHSFPRRALQRKAILLRYPPATLLYLAALRIPQRRRAVSHTVFDMANYVIPLRSRPGEDQVDRN